MEIHFQVSKGIHLAQMLPLLTTVVWMAVLSIPEKVFVSTPEAVDIAVSWVGAVRHTQIPVESVSAVLCDVVGLSRSAANETAERLALPRFSGEAVRDLMSSGKVNLLMDVGKLEMTRTYLLSAAEVATLRGSEINVAGPLLLIINTLFASFALRVVGSAVGMWVARLPKMIRPSPRAHVYKYVFLEDGTTSALDWLFIGALISAHLAALVLRPEFTMIPLPDVTAVVAILHSLSFGGRNPRKVETMLQKTRGAEISGVYHAVSSGAPMWL